MLQNGYPLVRNIADFQMGNDLLVMKEFIQEGGSCYVRVERVGFADGF